MALLLFFAYVIFTLLVLARALGKEVWEVGSVLYLLTATWIVGLPMVPGLLLWLFVLVTVLVNRFEPLRQAMSDFFYQRAQNSIPKLSQTEEEALNAGDTWLEKDIFTGNPDWQKVSTVSTELTEEERAFLENETQQLCGMLDEWSTRQEQDLPENVWTFLREKGFFGLVISKDYGGKGFSARAHSDVVMKIATRCGVAAVTVMVPNSLGPGELLHFYGTEKQKKHYLPRLANGTDIPCFALTEPGAGSDATSIKSEARVVQKKVEGKRILGLELTLNKRWITLSPVATLIGLAVSLKDPDGLLQGEGEEGITCLLIGRDTANLEIGNRHLPADQPFMNGTIRGDNIFVPMDAIIGGQKMAGQGWRMLVECLSIGRSISLPALAAASSSVSYLTTGAFARIRRQFNVEIGQFEGVEEKLAEIAGLSYLINALRLLTVAAVQEHKKPSVASVITKYFNTELARIVINDAMDVHAGRSVVVGPRNYLTSLYQGIPISITVEGANIMSRNLLIFGQGSIACHPFVREEIGAIRAQDKAGFHRLMWQHIHYFMGNMAKTLLSTWTAGYLSPAPANPLKRGYQKVNRLSYAFAWLADLSLIVLGGDLKRKERLSARLADGLSYLYMAMAALRLYEQNEQHADEKQHAQWAVSYSLYRAQKAMLDFCQNLPWPGLGFLIRLLAFPLGQTMPYPTDVADHKLARLMMGNNHYRDWMKQFVYLSGDAQQPVDRMEETLQKMIASQALYEKIPELKRFKFAELKEKLAERVARGELSQAEMDQLVAVEHARWDAVQVDEFAFDAMKKARFHSVTSDLANPLD
ncbi:MAG: acyl-CoA dehydrogenase [Legionellaceae bacterium]|nr:acyl-CoA dehydrogenase [Legionellaceae bacterium]